MSKKKVYCKNCKFGLVSNHLRGHCDKILAPERCNKYTGFLEALPVFCYPKEENSNGECKYYSGDTAFIDKNES